MPHLSASTSNSPPSSANTPTQNSSNPKLSSSASEYNTSPPYQTPRSPSSRSASPVPPPVSPITPTLSAARLASHSNVDANVNLGPGAQNVSIGSESRSSGQPQRPHIGGKNIAIMNNNRVGENPIAQPKDNHPGAQAHAHSFKETYTHTQQTPQVSMPQPKPQTINFDENPDVLAMKSTISILQLQARNAERDMVTLQRIKERAAGDPEGFVGSLMEGQRKADAEAARKKGREARRAAAGGEESSSDEDEDEETDALKEETDGAADAKWEKLPTPQSIVRCPPVNWAKYGVVGESLDRLHQDQIRRPSEGYPATINADGSATHKFGDGAKREYTIKKPLGLNEVISKSKKKKSNSNK
ncbi:hypothetical protein MFRU_001g04750 [Monilinia fructicola]|uniref:Uncharacterized protein n=1 Tax=Monilinia fructicola TaxID=38448 RepID=A0A5M9K3X9_MONFR|nr:hypothetical protein EYC84_005139 [Monilinia fructicola]KAG4035707.1 hypothetical protein MFRU_001g04750 [Monilinia fructicola]